MGRGGGVAGAVEQGAASDGEHERMPIDVVAVDRRTDLIHRRASVLDRLSAGQYERGRDQIERAGVRGEVRRDLAGEARAGFEEPFVDHGERACAVIDDAPEQGVAGAENALREAHREPESDLELLVYSDA